MNHSLNDLSVNTPAVLAHGFLLGIDSTINIEAVKSNSDIFTSASENSKISYTNVEISNPLSSVMQYSEQNSFINFPIPKFDNIDIEKSTGGDLKTNLNWSSLLCTDGRKI